MPSRGPGADWRPEWKAAADDFGTPLYVYDLPTLERQARRVLASLPESVTVHYALKANGSLALVGELRRLGLRADVSTGGELASALAAGFDPAELVYTGPAKTDADLGAALDAGTGATGGCGVGLIVVESAAQAARVDAAAATRRVLQRVLLRVNPGRGLRRAGIVVGDLSCQFGVDESTAVGTAIAIRRLASVSLEGIHVSTETNVLSAERLLGRARFAVDLARRLRSAGLPVPIVDLGGGIGVPSCDAEPAFDLTGYGSGLDDLGRANPQLRFILELGRCLVAECGTFVTRVVDRKRSGGRTFVLVDGGINHLYRPALDAGGRPPHVISSSGATGELVTIAGPLCDAGDIVARDVTLSAPRIDDLVAVRSTGAYGYGHGLLGFSLQPTAAEAIWDGRRAHLVRRRGTPADVLRGQLGLPGREGAGTEHAAGRAAETVGSESP